MDDQLICAHCGEPIGVYEPLVVVADGIERETSRAAEPQPARPGAAYYHRPCRRAVEDDWRSDREPG